MIECPVLIVGGGPSGLNLALNLAWWDTPCLLVNENPETPSKYQIRGIPTMILFNNGSIVDTKVGASSKKDLTDWINQHIA